MILSGNEIRTRLGGDIIIEPFNEGQLNPNSYNVRLHKELLVYGTLGLDMKRENPTSRLSIPDEGLVLQPGRIYLGRTEEYTVTDNLVPMLEGRSSIGRLGLSIHSAAGFGDIGFRGHWTMILTCVQPTRIYAGVQIGQIFYHTVEGQHDTGYSGKYQSSLDIQPSKLHLDFN